MPLKPRKRKAERIIRASFMAEPNREWSSQELMAIDGVELTMNETLDLISNLFFERFIVEGKPHHYKLHPTLKGAS